jgi:hypothetical protein
MAEAPQVLLFALPLQCKRREFACRGIRLGRRACEDRANTAAVANWQAFAIRNGLCPNLGKYNPLDSSRSGPSADRFRSFYFFAPDSGSFGTSPSPGNRQAT